jgi:hypothetical protein
VDRCTTGCYAGTLGVFFNRDCVLLGAKPPDSKAIVFSGHISGQLLFSNSTDMAALARHGFPSMLQCGTSQRPLAGVAVGFLSLVNHVCAPNDDHIALQPQRLPDFPCLLGRVQVDLLRVGGQDTLRKQYSQLLVTYDGRNRYGSPLPNGCACEVCRAGSAPSEDAETLDADAETCLDDTETVDQAFRAPTKRKRSWTQTKPA